MHLAEFYAVHAPALEQDEVRHNLILGLLARALDRGQDGLLLWTVGGPGCCAIKTPGRAIILGQLTRESCAELAKQTRDLDYPGVTGPGETACRFAEAAGKAGIAFAPGRSQRIHVLSRAPRTESVEGYARKVTTDDFELFSSWTNAFAAELTPPDPPSTSDQLWRIIGEARHWLWISGGEPASIAGIVRRCKTTAAIALVYTPPAFRCRGYAGAVTAAVANAIFAEGRKTACLYTDLSNPASNRCYAKLGFEPVCDSWFFERLR